MTPTVRTATPADLAALRALLPEAAGDPAALVGAGTLLVAETVEPGGGSRVVAAGLPGDGTAGRRDDDACGDPVGASRAALWVAAHPQAAAAAAALAGALVRREPGSTAEGSAAAPQSFASIHVQTDDVSWVERTVRQVVPRLGRSAGSVVMPPRDGWVAVYDDLCDRDRRAHRRLADELSVRLGLVAVALAVEEGKAVRMLLFERGRMVDEYLSLPTWDGPQPPGEQLALAVNPTLVARLTGAEPAAVRAVARTASSGAELPPAAELVQQIAALLGLADGAAGFAAAALAPGGTPIAHG